MKKRILSMLLAFVMVLGMFPGHAMATGEENDGTVYISISFDGKYINDKNEAPIVYRAISLTDIAAVDLAEYGLDNMLFDGDGDGNYETTALQLIIYAHEKLYGGDWSEVNFTATPGSSYFAGGVFGFTENLVYFHNGDFPVDESQTSDYMTVGATSDRIVLEDGDFLDIASFGCYAFLWDQLGGFHLFADQNDNYVHDYTAAAGEALTVKVKHSFCDLMYGQSWVKDADSYEVYYGTTFGEAEGSVTTDGSGNAEITFPNAGTYYVWCDGAMGSDDGTHGSCDHCMNTGEPCIVSSPAYAKVTVTGGEKPECEHIDANFDHVCDRECGKNDIGEHADTATDKDHVCDYGCGAKMNDCSDASGDKDHKCDVCGAENITGHDWDDATCDTPKTCTECGATDGKALGHDYDEGTVTKEPTCTEAGEKTYKCKREGCAGTKTEALAALGHIDENKDNKCDRCETVLCTDDSHTEEIIAGKAATCTETGLTEGKKCSACGKILVEQKVIPALGHDYDEGTVTKEPTCTEAGEKTYKCKREGCAGTKTEALAALGHIDENKDNKCDRCETVLCTDDSHTEEIIAGKAATCTETGLTEGKKCSACGKVLVEQKVIPALGHDYDEGTVTKEPTCTEAGEKTYKCKREGCAGTKTEALAALGHIDENKDNKCDRCETVLCTDDSHTEEIIAGKAATCTETGLTEGKKCSACGKILVEQEVIAALGHDYDDGVVTKEPTTTEVGEKTYTCQREGCDHSYTEEIPMIEVEVKLDAPTVKVSNIASSGKIKVSWSKVEGAEKYEIWASTSKNGKYTKLGTVTKTSVTHSSATAGKTYYYKVRAIAGDVVGEFSTAVGRTCDCARPTVKTSNIASTGKIKISWNKVDGAVKYEVYRATSKNGKYTKLTTTTKTSVTNSKIEAGATYYYRVKAIAKSSAANSAASTAVGRTCDLARPTVTVKLNSSGKPVISWKKVTGAVKYAVYRATRENGTYTLLGTTTKTSITNGKNVEAGVTYYYKVRAIAKNSAANSAYSAVAYITAK